MKKWAKKEILTSEERWEKEEKERKFTMRERERERERERIMFKKEKRESRIDQGGCWNNKKKNIKWLFKENNVYNRQIDVGIL